MDRNPAVKPAPTFRARTVTPKTSPNTARISYPGTSLLVTTSMRLRVFDRANASLELVVHQLARRLGDRSGQRRIDRYRVRQLVDGQVVLHRHRDRQDQLARLGRHDHAADDVARGRPAEQFHE